MTSSYGSNILVAILDALGIERASVVGNSFGGSLALAAPPTSRNVSNGWC